MEKCENCKFGGGKVNNQGLIDCRRFPPTMVSGSQYWPPGPLFGKTFPKQWCGEWKPIITDEMKTEAKEWAEDEVGSMVD